MEDEIFLFNGSRISDELAIAGFLEVDKIRHLVVSIVPDSKKILEPFLSKHYNADREQVDASGLLVDICSTELGSIWKPGKFILFDYDIYDGSEPHSNWFFGGVSKTNVGLGYLILSTARFQGEIHARDILKHEAGHLFNAPSKGRSNTYEHLGLHCSNNFCVMQQKDTVPSSIKYAHERARKKASAYCYQCEDDIRNFKPRY